jgi:hypothetical protein
LFPDFIWNKAIISGISPSWLVALQALFLFGAGSQGIQGWLNIRNAILAKVVEERYKSWERDS